MKRAHARSGFTILEVLVAMAILLFGMTTILGLLTYGTALSRTAQLRTSAASAAQATIADLEETFFPEVAGGGYALAPEAHGLAVRCASLCAPSPWLNGTPVCGLPGLPPRAGVAVRGEVDERVAVVDDLDALAVWEGGVLRAGVVPADPLGAVVPLVVPLGLIV